MAFYTKYLALGHAPCFSGCLKLLYTQIVGRILVSNIWADFIAWDLGSKLSDSRIRATNYELNENCELCRVCGAEPRTRFTSLNNACVRCAHPTGFQAV
ncbi:hypothetical protein ACKLNO_11540 [Neisseriaceae bacterium B1]